MYTCEIIKLAHAHSQYSSDWSTSTSVIKKNLATHIATDRIHKILKHLKTNRYGEIIKRSKYYTNII